MSNSNNLFYNCLSISYLPKMPIQLIDSINIKTTNKCINCLNCANDLNDINEEEDDHLPFFICGNPFMEIDYSDSDYSD